MDKLEISFIRKEDILSFTDKFIKIIIDETIEQEGTNDESKFSDVGLAKIVTLKLFWNSLNAWLKGDESILLNSIVEEEEGGD